MTSAFSRRAAFAAYSGGAVAIGYALRGADEEQKRRQLPMGWRACCESRALTPAQQALPDKLTAIVGALNVERGVEQRGSRMGRGEAFVVVKPGSLREALEALQACVDADACVIPQGANTGLTGGSVPREMGVDRPTVVINMLRLNHIMPIDDGKRMVCSIEPFLDEEFRELLSLAGGGVRRAWAYTRSSQEHLQQRLTSAHEQKPAEGGAAPSAKSTADVSKAPPKEEEARQTGRVDGAARATQNDMKKGEGVGLLAKSVLAGRVHRADS